MSGCTGATVVDAAHGSWLTCGRRLGCTDPEHRALRLAYQHAVYERFARRRGVKPRKLGRTHGTRATYHVCTAGPDGGTCQPCRDAEARYVAERRARLGLVRRPGSNGGRWATA